ncbi:hypothetical protein JYQ62_24235 [Nostoc sp. UHCC 0702]|nr:hypothetical protein JYQ62_24235 [Nostoc sp. UHCC 0702]
MSAVFPKNFAIEYSPKQRVWSEIVHRIRELQLPGVPMRLILTALCHKKLTLNVVARIFRLQQS